MNLNQTELLPFILCSQQIHQADDYAESAEHILNVYSLLSKLKRPTVRDEMSTSVHLYCNSLDVFLLRL